MPEFEPKDSGWPRGFRYDIRRVEGTHLHSGDAAHCLAFGSVHFAPNIMAFEKEPSGDDYRALLELAESHCHAFSLVWRDQLSFEESALALAQKLKPWLCYERHTNRWRGTTLFESLARVRWYRITQSSISLIAEPDRLYGWCAPSYPEDLAFYHRDGRGWVGSISHEELGWLDLDAMDQAIANRLTFLR